MRLIQDAVNDIKPTPEEAKVAIDYFNHLLPQFKHCICGGYVGDWRMLPNGSTCFYCPPIALTEKEEMSC